MHVNSDDERLTVISHPETTSSYSLKQLAYVLIVILSRIRIEAKEKLQAGSVAAVLIEINDIRR